MNKSISILFLFVFFIACGNKTQEKQTILTTDASIVNVYYFHGKQRCKTCITVGDQAGKTITENYADNSKVKFIEIETSDRQFENLVNKYEVSWNALIIAKGEDFIDITEEAFAHAISNPIILSDLIKKEVNKRASE